MCSFPCYANSFLIRALCRFFLLPGLGATKCDKAILVAEYSIGKSIGQIALAGHFRRSSGAGKELITTLLFPICACLKLVQAEINFQYKKIH